MTIKEKIRAIRESKGISLAFVADNIGMERSNYSRLERALEDRIYFDTIEKVCKALGITIYELLAYGEPKDWSNGHPLADQELAKLEKKYLAVLESERRKDYALIISRHKQLFVAYALVIANEMHPPIEKAFTNPITLQSLFSMVEGSQHAENLRVSLPTQNKEDVNAIIREALIEFARMVFTDRNKYDMPEV